MEQTAVDSNRTSGKLYNEAPQTHVISRRYRSIESKKKKKRHDCLTLVLVVHSATESHSAAAEFASTSNFKFDKLEGRFPQISLLPVIASDLPKALCLIIMGSEKSDIQPGLAFHKSFMNMAHKSKCRCRVRSGRPDCPQQTIGPLPSARK